MWRYDEVLPAPRDYPGEGIDALDHAERSAREWDYPHFYIRRRAEPYRLLKARGLSAAVTMAKGLGATTLALPTAGMPEAQQRRRNAAKAGLGMRDRDAGRLLLRRYRRVASVRRGRAVIDGLISRLRPGSSQSTRQKKVVRGLTLKEPTASKVRRRWDTSVGKSRWKIDGRHHLPNGRRRGANRHVEGVRGARSHGPIIGHERRA